tara:strand:+ start:2299 stop:2769 length:471 start_codon:yes stop_codon:yes gene_type:complete
VNIFVLDYDPSVAAKYACDKHVVKMILESAQMLCSVHPEGTAPYKRSFYNHPCTKWVRESAENYEWLIDHAMALCNEYTNRYGKVHKSQQVIEWCDKNRPALPYGVGRTSFAQAMPEEYKNENAVKAYRSYYLGEKATIATWKNAETPFWFQEALV